MVNTEIRLIIVFDIMNGEDGEALYSQQKQDKNDLPDFVIGYSTIVTIGT